MNRLQRELFSITCGLALVAGLLVYRQAHPQPAIDLPAWLLFTFLFLLTDTLSLPIGDAFVSLAATAAIGAMLVIGPWAAGWIALAGSLFNVALRGLFPGRFGAPNVAEHWLTLAGIGMFNAALLAVSLFAGAAVYLGAGGPIPLRSLDASFAGPYVLLVLAFGVVNYSLAGGYILLRTGRAGLNQYVRSLPRVVFYEIAPLVFTPLVPLLYTQLGPMPFLLFSAGLASASLLTRNLAITGERLEKRVSELNMIGALGQALAASLQTGDLLATLREQLPRIMSVGGLYVALWQPDIEEVSFPLAVENGRLLEWPSRRSFNGLTEFVMRNCRPVLLPDSVAARAQAMGLTPPETRATAWLAVPIIAGSQVLGALGVYAVDEKTQLLDDADRDLLVTVATQLAVALTNARQYGRTDEALAQRVQQLSSILYTTAEGILLLDSQTQVLTANRALASFVGLPGGELAGRRLRDDDELLERLGANRQNLEGDLAALRNGTELIKRNYTAGGPPQREVERTLVPVRGGAGDVAGWLMVLRDVTEEQALERLRDDLTYMLIHDLRGPLSSILTSLALIQQMALPGRPLEAEAADVLNLARGSGQHLLHMINELLDIARIESGGVPLEREQITPDELVAGALERLRPAAEAASIELVAEVATGLPELSVDSQLIGRVLDNLCDNAVKFSPNGTTVRLWARLAAPAPGVLFGVSDQGPGIAPDAQKHLFEKFHRVPYVQGRRTGSGLGLAFCRMVVEAHGGEVTVESDDGQGSTFIVRLPVTE